MVLFPNLVPLAESGGWGWGGGRGGCKTTQPLIGDMSFGKLWLQFPQILIKLDQTVHYERSPNFCFLPS